MDRKVTRAAVVGGGPSGLCAAISCSHTLGKGSTLVLEKQSRVGRKLLASGNGRCNISNTNISESHYHGDNSLIRSVLSEFPGEAMRGFMRRLGVILRSDEEGRLYPYSNQAAAVLDALTDECRRQGAGLLPGFDIKEIRRENGSFVISSDNSEVRCEYLIFATGSSAAPYLGADSSGYSLLGGLGIKHSPLFPALCPVVTKESCRALKGVRARGSVTLISDGKKTKERNGEIQFTENGLSGICVFELSRDISEFLSFGTIDGRKCGSVRLSADLMRDFTFSEVCSFIEERKKLLGTGHASLLLNGALNKLLSAELAKRCGLSEKPCSALKQTDIKKLAGSAKGALFTPVDSGGLASAQVCAGGIGSDEIEPSTLRARRIKNLYICGELLDVDGDCGGFNLHFAAGSGLLAGKLL